MLWSLWPIERFFLLLIEYPVLQLFASHFSKYVHFEAFCSVVHRQLLRKVRSMQLCFFLSLGNSAYRGYKQRFHFPKHFTRGDILHSMYQLVNHCICYRHYEYCIDRRVVCSTHAFLYRCKLFCWLQILGRVSSIWSSTSVALFSFLSRIFKGHTNSQAFVATEFQEVLVFSFLRVLWTLQFSALFRRRQTRLCC